MKFVLSSFEMYIIIYCLHSAVQYAYLKVEKSRTGFSYQAEALQRP